MRIFSIYILGLLFFIFISLLAQFNSKKIEQHWLSRQTPSTQKMYEILSKPSNWGAQDEELQVITQCIFNVRMIKEEHKSKIDECRQQYGKGILIIGDSHAIDLFGTVASQNKFPFLIGVTQGGCRLHNTIDDCDYKGIFDFIKANKNTFRLLIYEQAGFYLLREREGLRGKRKMFTKHSTNEHIVDIVVDEENVNTTIKVLADLSGLVKINWFLPRAEPHIAKSFVLKNGCSYHYSFRPNLYKTFENLDRYIENSVQERFGDRIGVISQNEMFKFDFPTDFINCDTIYWTDGDHLSEAGEEYFGKRLKPELFE